MAEVQRNTLADEAVEEVGDIRKRVAQIQQFETEGLLAREGEQLRDERRRQHGDREGGDAAGAYAAQASGAADRDPALDVHANPAFGMWADRTEQSVDALIDEWRAPRDFGGAS